MDDPIPGMPADFLWLLAARIAPDSQKLDAAGRERYFKIIADTLGQRPASLRRQFRLFLAVLRWSPLLRHGAPLDKLAPEAQDQVLRSFQDSRFSLLRKGFWGLKAMLLMGYYGQADVAEALSYRASKDGNSLLRPRFGTP